jgi:hypothetical protein
LRPGASLRSGGRLGPVGEVVGAGLRNVYRKKKGAMTLLGDRGRRGGHGGEAGEAKMLCCSGNLSPEFAVAVVRSGRGRTRRSGVHEDRKTCQGGAPVEDREDRRRGGGSGSPKMMNSIGNARRCGGVRRGNSVAWRGIRGREKRGQGRSLRGLYREWWRGEGVRVRSSGDDGRRRGSRACPGLLDGG